MPQIQVVEQERHEHRGLWQSNTGLPSPVSSTMSPAEAWSRASPAITQNFEMCGQIQPHSEQQDEKNQDKKLWNSDQQNILLDLHHLLGNRWTDIANQLACRDHNSVKNHFYAKIRKSLRRINHFVKMNFNKQLKQLNMTHVSKMITLLSQKKPNEMVVQVNNEDVKEIKEFLFLMSQKHQDEKLDADLLQKMKHYVKKISELLEAVKKNNLIIKNKNKRKDKCFESKRNCIRESSTVKHSPKQEAEHPIPNSSSTQDKANPLPIIPHQSFENNFMVMFLPCQMASQYSTVVPHPYQYSWVNPINQVLYYGSNIYGNS